MSVKAVYVGVNTCIFIHKEQTFGLSNCFLLYVAVNRALMKKNSKESHRNCFQVICSGIFIYLLKIFDTLAVGQCFLSKSKKKKKEKKIKVKIYILG